MAARVLVVLALPLDLGRQAALGEQRGAVHVDAVAMRLVGDEDIGVDAQGLVRAR